MRIRDTRLEPDEQVRFDAAMRAVETRSLAGIKRVLLRIPHAGLQQLTYELAFKPGPLLPKRTSRPQLTIAHLSELLRALCSHAARSDSRLTGFWTSSSARSSSSPSST